MAKKSNDDTKDIIIEYLPMDVGGACDYKYDEKLFSDGIDTGSYLAGIGTALKNMNANIDEDQIVEILKCVIENNYGLETGKE